MKFYHFRTWYLLKMIPCTSTLKHIYSRSPKLVSELNILIWPETSELHLLLLNMIQFNSDAEIHDVKSDDLNISIMMLMSSHLRWPCFDNDFWALPWPHLAGAVVDIFIYVVTVQISIVKEEVNIEIQSGEQNHHQRHSPSMGSFR